MTYYYYHLKLEVAKQLNCQNFTSSMPQRGIRQINVFFQLFNQKMNLVCSCIMTRDIFPRVITVIKCNSINFQEITFHCTYSKLRENAVTFNQCYSNFAYEFIKFNYIQYNYVTCNLATILTAKLIRKERKPTGE